MRQGRVLRRVRCGSVLLYSTAPAQKQGARLPTMRHRRIDFSQQIKADKKCRLLSQSADPAVCRHFSFKMKMASASAKAAADKPAPGLPSLRYAHRFAVSNHPCGEFGYFLLTQKMQIAFTICRACGLSPFFICLK